MYSSVIKGVAATVIAAVTQLTVAETSIKVQNLSDINTNKSSVYSYSSYGQAFPFSDGDSSALLFMGRSPEEGVELWAAKEDMSVEMVADIYPGMKDSHPKLFTSYSGQVFFSAEGPDGRELYIYDGSTVELVMDINPDGSSEPEQLTEYQGYLYFVADDGVHGRELWRTDGSQTERLSDINNEGDSAIANLTPFGDWMYFTANNVVQGHELYRTNGETTELFKEFRAGNSHGVKHESPMIVYGDKLLVHAYTNVVGYELHFVADDHQTVPLLFDAVVGADSITAIEEMHIAPDGLLYFTPQIGVHEELWSYNGVNIPEKEAEQDTIDFLCDFDGALMLSSNVLEGNGVELYRVKSGQVDLFFGLEGEIADINSGAESSNPNSCVVYNNVMYFKAVATDRGEELLKLTLGSFDIELAYETLEGQPSDTLGVLGVLPNGPVVYEGLNRKVRLFDSNNSETNDFNVAQASGVDSGNVNNWTKAEVEFQGELYFTAYTEEFGVELWRTDGHDAELVHDINSGKAGSKPANFMEYDNWLYFAATTLNEGRELWRTNGEITELFADLEEGPESSYPTELIPFYGYLFFVATIDGLGGELIATNGDDIEVALDLNPGAGSSDPAGLTLFNDMLVFAANDGTHGRELWVYIEPGQYQIVSDINPGASSSNPSQLIKVGSTLYFSASTPQLGREKWSTDMDSYIEPLLDIYPGANSSSPGAPISHQGSLYFTASSDTGRKVWRATGDTVTEVASEADLSFGTIASTGENLYALATNQAYGTELWEMQNDNFVLVQDFTPGEGSILSSLAVSNGHLLGFSASSSGTDGIYLLSGEAEDEWNKVSMPGMDYLRMSSFNAMTYGKYLITRGCNNDVGCEFFKVVFNELPVISVTAPDEVDETLEVVIDASGSTDSDGIITDISLVQLSGPAVSLSQPETGVFSFTAPEVDEDILISFEIEVVDDDLDVTKQTLNINVLHVADEQGGGDDQGGDTPNPTPPSSGGSGGGSAGLLLLLLLGVRLFGSKLFGRN
ncbi:MAG TPA: hypothetical protein VIM93_07410 [Kangiella sp.]